MATKVKVKRQTRSTKNQVAQIYLIEAIGLFRYKMGWAFSAADRCEKLKRAQPPVNYQIIEVFDCYNAEGIETALHKRYAAYKVELEHSEEWFEFPAHVLQEVIGVYKDYQRQWKEEGAVKPVSNTREMEVIAKLLEKLTRIGKQATTKQRVGGLNRKASRSKKVTVWSIVNLVLEVIGGTAVWLIKSLIKILIGKKSRYQSRGRRGFSTGLYYHRNQQSAFNRIGAAAIALFAAGIIVAMIL